MPSQKEILIKACAANGLATSGTVTMLLQRLVKGSPAKKANPNTNKSTANKAKRIAKEKAKSVAKKGAVVKPTKTTPYKTAGGKTRLSASYYFHELCQGKISRCTPQLIEQSDGRLRLKEIKIVSGKTGAHPMWVLVKD